MKFVLALLRRNLVAGRSSARLTLIRVVLQPAIYLFVFGHVVGRMMPVTGSVEYKAVIVPGIIAMISVNASFVSISGQVLSGYFFRTMEGWLLAPISLRTLLAGMVLSGVCSGLVNSLIVAGLAWAILGLSPDSPLYLVAATIAGTTFSSLLTIIVLLFPQRPDRGQEVFSFLMMPMTFFGCTFYSHAMLESPFSQLALLLPTTYISETLRAAYAPSQPHLDADTILVGLALVTALLVPIADWAFRRRLGNFSW